MQRVVAKSMSFLWGSTRTGGDDEERSAETNAADLAALSKPVEIAVATL